VLIASLFLLQACGLIAVRTASAPRDRALTAGMG